MGRGGEEGERGGEGDGEGGGRVLEARQGDGEGNGCGPACSGAHDNHRPNSPLTHTRCLTQNTGTATSKRVPYFWFLHPRQPSLFYTFPLIKTVNKEKKIIITSSFVAVCNHRLHPVHISAEAP